MTEKQITVPPQLEDILLEYTVRVLVDNPNDIISHAADYFTNLKDERGPVGMMGNPGNTEISNMLGARSARRGTVVGERYNPEEEEDDDEDEVYSKTDDDRKRIMECTKDIFLFKALDQESLNKVIDAMMPREVEKGQVIIKQGDDGDFFYVVDRGSFDTFITDGNEEKFVKTYEDSGSFGELALLHNQPRAATVKASSDGLVWAVSRRSFIRLIVKGAFKKRQNYKKMLENVPELQSLSDYEKMQVCDALVPVTLQKDEVVFNEGDDGDGMYFVEEGKVSVKKSTKKKGEKEMTQLKKGEYFGEMALVKNQPRAATVTAVEDTKLAFLEVKAFERLLGPCLDVMKRRVDTYEKA